MVNKMAIHFATNVSCKLALPADTKRQRPAGALLQCKRALRFEPPLAHQLKSALRSIYHKVQQKDVWKLQQIQSRAMRKRSCLLVLVKEHLIFY